jgi:hypothetical protein
MKKAASVPASKKTGDAEKCTISISREELFKLHNIAAGIQLLREITKEAPEMQLIQVELLTNKTAHCAWTLIHEELDSRWQERHPDVDLIQRH